MIPLHLQTTTTLVTRPQAQSLIAHGVACWIPGVDALALSRGVPQPECERVLGALAA